MSIDLEEKTNGIVKKLFPIMEGDHECLPSLKKAISSMLEKKVLPTFFMITPAQSSTGYHNSRNNMVYEAGDFCLNQCNLWGKLTQEGLSNGDRACVNSCLGKIMDEF